MSEYMFTRQGYYRNYKHVFPLIYTGNAVDSNVQKKAFLNYRFIIALFSMALLSTIVFT